MGALVAMAVGLLTGAWAAALGLRLGGAWIACVAVLGIGLLIAFSARSAGARPGARAWLPFAICTALIGQSLVPPRAARSLEAPTGPVRLRGEVISSWHSSDMVAAVVEIAEGTQLGSHAALAPGMRVWVRDLDLPSGSRVSFVAHAQPTDRFLNPTPHPPWPSVHPVGARARLVGEARLDRAAPFWERATHALRATLRARLSETLGPAPAALSRALLLNESGALEEDAQAHVRDAGLAHVLAVSGLHVTLLAGVFVWLCARVLLRFERLAARLDVRRLAKGIGIPFALAYALLVGDAPSAWRAALTSSIAWGLVAAGRRAHPITVTAAAALLMAALRPDDLARPGFILSILATAALVSDPSDDASFARAGLVASARTTVATAPFVLWMFGQVPLISLLANLVVVPLGGVLLPVVALHAALALVLPPLAHLSAPLVEVTSSAFLASSEVFAAIPGGRDLPPPDLTQGAVIAIAALALLIARRWRTRLIMLALAALALAGAEGMLRHRELPKGELRASFLDVGQGDGALVDLPDGKLMVVDAGGAVFGGPDPGERALVPLLRARRRARIDVLIISHPHPDHYGGASALLDAFEIGEIWDSGQAETEQPDGELAALLARARRRGAIVRYPEELCGGPRRFGSARARLLFPCPSYDAGWDPNDNSLVVELEMAGRRLLFTGDAEAHAEGVLSTLPTLTTVDVLKVAHHGSRTSSAPELLARLRPHVAIASMGRHNHYGHPHEEVWSRLVANVKCAFRTDRHGGVVVEVRADGTLEARPTVERSSCVAPRALKRTPPSAIAD